MDDSSSTVYGDMSTAVRNDSNSSRLNTVESQSVLILAYTLSVALSIVGNTTAIVVFSKGGRSRTELRPFLINLAVADLIMAIFCIPFTSTTTILDRWVFSAPMCPIVLFLQLLSVTVSVSTNTVIGLDRLWAVALPLRKRLSKKNVRGVIVIVWLVSIALSSVQLVIGRVKDTGQCVEKWPSPSKVWKRYYTLFVMFVTYVIPLSVLTITYTIVGSILRSHKPPGNEDEWRDSQQLSFKRKVVKMLVTIVLVFGLCWLPLHIFMLVVDFNPQIADDMQKSPHHAHFITAIFFAVHWLAMSNSFANPIIYGFMNESFRADLKYLAYKFLPCCRSDSMRQRYNFLRIHRPNASSIYLTAKESPCLRNNSARIGKFRDTSGHPTSNRLNDLAGRSYGNRICRANTCGVHPKANNLRRALARSKTLSEKWSRSNECDKNQIFTRNHSQHINGANEQKSAPSVVHNNGMSTRINFRDGRTAIIPCHNNDKVGDNIDIRQLTSSGSRMKYTYRPRLQRMLRVMYRKSSAVNGLRTADGVDKKKEALRGKTLPDSNDTQNADVTWTNSENTSEKSDNSLQ